MGATLDGRIEATGAVFEAKFMLPWSFSEEAATGKHMAQLQHNMWVVASRTAVLSVITGGGKWVEITTHADPLYQHLIVTAERKFWRSVESGEPPSLFGVEPPKPRLQAVRMVNMSDMKPHGGKMRALIRPPPPVDCGWRPIPCRQLRIGETSIDRPLKPASPIREIPRATGRSAKGGRIAKRTQLYRLALNDFLPADRCQPP
jgi:hypothetical protein